MAWLLGFGKWVISDLRNIVIVVLASGIVVSYLGWRWEGAKADSYLKDSQKYQAALEEQKKETEACNKNKQALFDACQEIQQSNDAYQKMQKRINRIKKPIEGGLANATADDLVSVTNDINSRFRERVRR